MTSARPDRLLRTLAGVAIVFGLLTILSGGRALFGDDAERAALGAIVPFVLWFNFVAGFAYVLVGIGLWQRRRWSWIAASALFGAHAFVFILFGLHALSGGAFELRTVAAMTLRTGTWLAIAMLSWRRLRATS